MAEDKYIGPGPGEWRNKNPDGQELFDIDEDRIFVKNRRCKELFCSEPTAYGSEYCLEHTDDVIIFQ